MSQDTYHYDAVLPPGVRSERVRDVLGKRGARKIGDIPRADAQLAEEVWEYADGDRVRLVHDHFVDVNSLRAESRAAGRPADLIFDLRAELGLQEDDDLIVLGRSAKTADRSHAIRGLAAIADTYGSDIVDTISSGLKDADRDLRDAALRAIARWPHFAFVRELEVMSQSEQDADLKREAQQLADEVRKHGRRGTH